MSLSYFSYCSLEIGRCGWAMLAVLGCAAAWGWCGALFAGRYVCLLGAASWRDTEDGAVFRGMPPDLALAAVLRGALRRRRRPGTQNRRLAALLVLSSAAAALPIFGRHGLTLACAASLAAVVLLLVLAVIDAHTGLLPDVLTLPLLWAGLALSWAGGCLLLSEAVGGAMLGYVGLYALFLAFRVVRRRDGMGRGDFKLAAAIGAWVGPLPLLHVLLVASLLGMVYAFWRAKSWGVAASYPFGPCLVAAAIPALALGPGLHSVF